MESSKLSALLLILMLSVSSTPVALACGKACPTPSGGHAGGIGVPGIIGTVPGIVGGGTVPGVVGKVPGIVGGTVPGVVGTVPGIVGGTVPGVVGHGGIVGGTVPGVVGHGGIVGGTVPGVVGHGGIVGGTVPGIVGGTVPGVVGHGGIVGGTVPGVVGHGGIVGGTVPGIVGGTVPGVVGHGGIVGGTVPGVVGHGGISIGVGVGVGVPGIVVGGSPKGAGGKGCPPPHAAAQKCPVDVLKLGACLDILGQAVHVAEYAPRCCPLIEGLASASAAACLCTTIKAKVLNQNIYAPLALQLLVTCGKSAPAGYTCPP